MTSAPCTRCGGTIGPSGRCSVCGQDTFNAQQAEQGQARDARGAATAAAAGTKSKPAFLFNKLTNERYALNQSVSKIGRDQTNNISITNDHYISRHHAWVLQMQGGYYVEDLGSTNGTLVNGELLGERRQISPGDRITFGKTELIFVTD